MFAKYPLKLIVIVIASVFALMACSDAPEEVSNQDQNDLNVGEEDAGISDDAGDENNDQNNDANAHNHSQPPSEPECMEVLEQSQACGGYLEGEWENGDVCTQVDPEDLFAQAGCDEAELEAFDFWVADGSGTVEFTDDQMTRDLVVIVDLDVYVPEQCLQFAGMEFECHEFESMAGDYVGLDMDCQEPADAADPDAPGCECIADEEEIDHSYDGQYEVDTDTALITLQPSGEQYYYCAEDGVLNMRNLEEGALPLTEAFTYVP